MKSGTEKVKQKVIDYQTVFGTPHGKRVLMDLMRNHHVLRSTYKPGDANETILREGERNVILRILAHLKTNPEQLSKMIDEGNENE